MEATKMEQHSTGEGWISCTLASFALSVTYVLSLYIWNISEERDHPETIKRRFISALSMTFISPLFVYLFGNSEMVEKHSVLSLIGIRYDNLYVAIAYPLLLTSFLFLGPIVMTSFQSYRFQLLRMPQYWKSCLSELIWWRNHVVAPFSEEFAFRACMIPILLGCFSSKATVIIAPLFFGTAHLHHLAERIRLGGHIQRAVFISIFQMTYTTVFGMYSAFLFIRTGHLIAPVIVHAFCNFLGFPDFSELLRCQGSKRVIFCVIYLLGVILFFNFLYPLTEPTLYSNNVYSW